MLQARGGAEPDGEKSPLLRERLRGLGPSVYVMTPALIPDKPSGPRKIFVIPERSLPVSWSGRRWLCCWT